MKKRILLILFCFIVILSQNISAQSELPKTSTAENPVWYYFQVKGTDSRKGRIFCLEGNDVYGKLFSDVTANQRDLYLWRFETNADGSYMIISKSSGKKLDIRQNDVLNIEVITVTENPAVTWNLTAYKDSWQIKSNGNKYVVQAGSSSNLNYVIMASTFGSSDNGSFSFVPFNDEKPQISDSEDVWYYIHTGLVGKTDRCITDINETGSGVVKFKVLVKDTDQNKLEAQQWKIIKPVNSTDENVFFVNRATQNIIQTAYDYNGYFNAQSTDAIEKSNGWTITFVETNQFKISGIDNQGITGYLNASSTTEPAELLPGPTEFLNSSYAWSFEPVSPITSIDDIPTPDPFDDITVKVINKRIYIEGTNDYTISHISGIGVEKNVELPAGVYLVTTKGKTKSYLVK